MIRHLFKLMWNQKRKNLGLLVEVFFSFLVIFAVFSFLVYNYSLYREQLGFDYSNVWVVQFDPNRDNSESEEMYTERTLAQLEQIDRIISNYPEFEAYTFTRRNVPYSGNRHLTAITHNGKEINPFVFATDEHYPGAMGITLVAGRWFNEGDQVQNGLSPIVINRQFKEFYFTDEDPIGKKIDAGDDLTYTVIGLIDNFKQLGEFSKPHPAFFRPSGEEVTDALLVKTKAGTDASVEARLFEDIQQITRGWSTEIRYMEDMRDAVLMETFVPSLIFLIISGFLIFNVALGLFGVIWQNINKRKQEIGVRRAVGASQLGIRWQIIGETAVLATLSLALGLFFAVQFPVLSVFNIAAEVYIVAMVLAVGFIYLIVFFCSFYPSSLAARLQPAVTLHEE